MLGIGCPDRHALLRITSSKLRRPRRVLPSRASGFVHRRNLAVRGRSGEGRESYPLQTLGLLPTHPTPPAEAGITRISGSIVGDASAFEDRHVPDGWRTRYLQRSYAARVSALSFNQNRMTVIVRPEGRARLVWLRPKSGRSEERRVGKEC